MALRFVPAHVNESTEPVDNLGGILSLVLVGALILAINFAPVPNEGTLSLGLARRSRSPRCAVFYFRQRRAPNPLYDLEVAARPMFWVAACAGHHRLRLADGRGVRQPAVPAERARLLDARGGRGLPARRLLHGARRTALGEARRGARRPLHAAAAATCSCLLAFLAMLLALEGGQSPTGRSASPTPRSASASDSPARRRRTRSPARCPFGVPAWHRAPPTSSATSAARSCSRSSARSSPPATRPPRAR